MLNEKQMQEYYADIAPHLTNYLIANGSSYEQACDIVQDSFIKLWQHRNEINDDDSIQGLVFRIAKNQKIDNYRKYKKEVLVDQFDDSVVPTTEDDNSTESDNSYLKSCIEKAMNSLPDDLRKCYTMYNIGELSIKEIANILGITESLVKVRIHRAKQKLAEKLKYLKDSGDI